MYDRRSTMDRRAGLRYDGPVEDAAWIASEVIRRGKSVGWVEEEAQRPIAAEIEGILSKFNIGYAGGGVWAHKAGGSRFFQR